MYPIHANPHTKRYLKPKHGRFTTVIYEDGARSDLPSDPQERRRAESAQSNAQLLYQRRADAEQGCCQQCKQAAAQGWKVQRVDHGAIDFTMKYTAYHWVAIHGGAKLWKPRWEQ